MAVRIETGVKNIRFEDENGEEFAHFKLNPTDIALAGRAQEVSQFLEEIGDKNPEDIQGIIDMNNTLEEKISYVIGCDRKDIFGVFPAITIFPSGQMYAMIVMETVTDTMKPALEERRKKMDEVAEKYLKDIE